METYIETTIETYKVLNNHYLHIFVKYLSPCQISITVAEISYSNGKKKLLQK